MNVADAASGGLAQEPELTTIAERYRSQLVSWRRHLHQNPELSYRERQTSEYIRKELDAMGGWRVTQPSETSVLAVRGGQDGAGAIAFRADIDALPIEEQSTHPYVSRYPGVMHACGHDGHTSILLGLARLLVDRPSLSNYEIRLLFQHAEEVFPGGARELVAADVLAGVEAVFGLHLSLDDDLGTIGVTSGPFLAGSDIVEIRLRGYGGHAGEPQTTRDPIVAAAALVGALQTIVSRNVDPLSGAVVSITSLHAGSAPNVIADQATLTLSVRYFEIGVRDLVHERIGQLTQGICDAFGVASEVDRHPGHPPVVNDPRIAALVQMIAVEEFGEDAVDRDGVSMASDDFSELLATTPGVYLAIGARNEARGLSYPHHHPRFDFDEAALIDGLRIFARIVADFPASSTTLAGG